MNNMKKILIGLLQMFFVLSCTNSRITLSNENVIIPKENISALLDSFVRENKHGKYVYELYIDKITPDSCNMILYCGEKSLTKEEDGYYDQKPVVCVILHGVKIYIYSGIERYFSSSLKMDTLTIQNNAEVLWAIRDSMGILSSYKIDGGYPFIPFPLKNVKGDFVPPVVVSK